MSEIPWVTTDEMAGRTVIRTLGGVRGNAIRARHLGRDFLAFLRNLVGGELRDYTKLLAQTRDQALDRLLDDADRLGADAVVGVRFATAEIVSGAAEILVYGTAVALADA